MTLLGASHRFDDNLESANITAENFNSLDTGGNVHQSKSVGGLSIEVTALEYWDESQSPPQRVTMAALVATALPPSTDSFVFLVPGGTAPTINQTGFPAGDHLPLAKVTTSATAVAEVFDRRTRVTMAGYDPEALFRTGAVYGPVPAQPGGSIALALNKIIAIPWPVRVRGSFDQVIAEVVVAGAGATTAQLMVYDESTSTPGEPGALIEDVGTIAIDSTGVKALALAATLARQRGRLFLAIASGDAAATFRSYVDTAVAAALLGLDAATLNGFGYWDGGAHTVGTAAPTPFPASPTAVVADVPFIGLRGA